MIVRSTYRPPPTTLDLKPCRRRRGRRDVQLLRELGCDAIQAIHLTRPLNANDMTPGSTEHRGNEATPSWYPLSFPSDEDPVRFAHVRCWRVQSGEGDGTVGDEGRVDGCRLDEQVAGPAQPGATTDQSVRQRSLGQSIVIVTMPSRSSPRTSAARQGTASSVRKMDGSSRPASSKIAVVTSMRVTDSSTSRARTTRSGTARRTARSNSVRARSHDTGLRSASANHASSPAVSTAATTSFARADVSR